MRFSPKAGTSFVVLFVDFVWWTRQRPAGGQGRRDAEGSGEDRDRTRPRRVPDECEVLASFNQTLTEENRKLKETFKGITEGGKTVSKDHLPKGLEKLGCTVDAPSAARLVEKLSSTWTEQESCTSTSSTSS